MISSRILTKSRNWVGVLIYCMQKFAICWGICKVVTVQPMADATAIMNITLPVALAAEIQQLKKLRRFILLIISTTTTAYSTAMPPASVAVNTPEPMPPRMITGSIRQGSVSLVALIISEAEARFALLG